MPNATNAYSSQYNLAEIAQQLRYAQDRALSIAPLTSTYPDLTSRP